ncbi:DUF2970 domain-containing protein [Pseudoalteromonas sp. MMG012]|uniref:DUF2970 domain-containing protein n=1 Tax=Pseudoalteromonas sp. MMG012 TaxID=2822686 RepID=UPI001B39F8A0|nr:DUF2970 domain-containing protein [Pseudoalteromonas sp. MMG012]MBQ4850507.1 DUF2970 domain-containing protein [Pseudoalteromonas sp. MMG012]
MKLLSIFQSVLAALFGVQSHGKYEFDFNSGSFLPYAVVGIALVTGFVVALVVLVNFILN